MAMAPILFCVDRIGAAPGRRIGIVQKQYTVTHNLDRAFAHFNLQLWRGDLPDCVITLQRKANSRGYFAPDAFRNRTDAKQHAHEIALNPDAFAGRTDAEILSTLVHEMAHLWQATYGKPGRGAYHNAEWAAEMLRVGLHPVSVTNPAKMTGDKMTHTIVPGGSFDRACASFLAAEGSLIHWEAGGAEAAERKPKSSKVKFTCPGCGVNAWGKESLFILCGACDMPMLSEDQQL